MALNASQCAKDAQGKLSAGTLDVDVAAGFNGGTPVLADGRIAVGSTVAVLVGGLAYDSAGRLSRTTAGPIAAWVGGLPVDASGRLVIESAAPVAYAQGGVPITATGAVAMTTGGADAIPPTAPTGLTATAASTTQIDLTWVAATDNVAVTGYRVERCTGAGCSNFAEIAQPAGTSYSDTGRTAGTSYSYQVRATDGTNLGAYSSPATAITPITPANLFAAGEPGCWYDPSDMSSLFQDSAGTTPVTAAGQPVGKMLDKSGRGNHIIQATAASRPTLQQTAGLWHLTFDGVDDWMTTAPTNFNMSSSDKVTVWVGVYKGTDAVTAGMLMEVSPATDTNNGSMMITAPGTVAQGNYRWRSKGTVIAEAFSTVGGATAPNTSVLTCRGDIAGDLCSISINAGTPVTTATDQGTGNWNAAVPMWMGRRGGAGNTFTGRVYGLIIRGATSTAGDIRDIERWMGAKTGVAIP